MIAWLLPLLGLLLLPVAGAALDETAETRRAGFRRSLSAAAHLAAAACVALLAAAAGRRPDHPEWDNSTVVLVLLAGAAWVEAVFLSGIRVHHRVASRDSGRRGDEGSNGAAGGEESEDAGAPPALGPEGEALLKRVLALDSLPVESIMLPREGVVSVDRDAPAAEAVRQMCTYRRKRIPVTADGSLDRILGVVHAKDLVPLIEAGGIGPSLRRHFRRCLRVPQGLPVAQLLAGFRRDRVHFGIVTDPMGRTLGVVTLEDVFRHLAGASETESGGREG